MQADLFDPEAGGRRSIGVDDLGAVVNLVGGFAEGPQVHETDLEDLERCCG